MDARERFQSIAAMRNQPDERRAAEAQRIVLEAVRLVLENTKANEVLVLVSPDAMLILQSDQEAQRRRAWVEGLRELLTASIVDRVAAFSATIMGMPLIVSAAVDGVVVVSGLGDVSAGIDLKTFSDRVRSTVEQEVQDDGSDDGEQ